MLRRFCLLFFFIVIVTISFLPDLTGPDSGKFPCAEAAVTAYPIKNTSGDTLYTLEVNGSPPAYSCFSITVTRQGEDYRLYSGEDIGFGIGEVGEGGEFAIGAQWMIGVFTEVEWLSTTITIDDEEYDQTPVVLGTLYPGQEHTVVVRFDLETRVDQTPVYLEVPAFKIYRDPPPGITIDGVNVLTGSGYQGEWNDVSYEGTKTVPVSSASVTLIIPQIADVDSPLVRNNQETIMEYPEGPGPWTVEVPLAIGINTIEISLSPLDIKIFLDRLPFSGLNINGTSVSESDITLGDGYYGVGPVTVTGTNAVVSLQAAPGDPVFYRTEEMDGPMPMEGSLENGQWQADIPLTTGYNWVEIQSSEQGWTLTIDIVRPPFVELRVNNNPVSISNEEIFFMQAAVTVTTANAALSLAVDPGYEISYWVGEDGEQTLMTGSIETGQWAAEVPLTLGENKVNILSGQDWMLEITITREEETVPPPDDDGGGGGGGGGAVPPAAPGASIDPGSNTLTPGNTQVEGDSSTSKVSDEEVGTLLKELAGKEGEDTVAQIQLGAEGEEGVNNYSLELSGNALNQLGSSAGSVGILSPVGNIYLRSEAVDGMNNRAADNITISMSRTEHEGRPGISVSIKQGANAVTTFAGSYSAEIRVPYVPGEGEDLSGLFIEYIHDDGTVEIINESRYDPEAKCLVFFVNHLSKFGVAYKPRLFADVSMAHWARGSITFLASRGIIHGVSAQKFEPERYISKAEFIQMMANAFSAANVGKKALPSFKDVKSNEWYARAIGWTYTNNISPTIAYADGRLGVNENIRREDVAVLINNLSLSLGLRIKAKSTAVAFNDTGGAASYAKSAISRISSVGIINGIGSGRFNPKGYCTRAEAAKIVSVLMSSL